MATLLDNASATGSAVAWAGGLGTVAVEGTFGGATVTIQMQSANDTWVSLGTDAELTAAGFINVELSPGNIRAAVSGGSPSGLYATIDHFTIGR